ncbi:hypothetical protein H0H93_013662 [Arthromyces matolae]|nr:hypothetical protein H0H93_013662 [Arthromyces matolae]
MSMRISKASRGTTSSVTPSIPEPFDPSTISTYTTTTEREKSHSLEGRKRIPISDAATADGHDVVDDENLLNEESADVTPADTPVKIRETRVRPLSELLGRTRRKPSYEGENGVLSILDAATNNLAHLINHLDLEATTTTPDLTPLRLSPAPPTVTRKGLLIEVSSSSPSGTSLARSRKVRRKGARSSRSYSSGYLTDVDALTSEDKENLSASGSGTHTPTYAPEIGTRSFDSRSYRSGSYTTSESGNRSGSYTYRTRSYTDSGSYTPSGSGSYAGRSNTSSGDYTSDSLAIRTGSDTITPGESSETGYDICFSSDMNGQLITTATSSASITPSSFITPLAGVAVDEEDVGSEENFVTASQVALTTSPRGALPWKDPFAR